MIEKLNETGFHTDQDFIPDRNGVPKERHEVGRREISRTKSAVTCEGRKQAFENSVTREEIEARKENTVINELRSIEMPKIDTKKLDEARELVEQDAKEKAKAAERAAAKAKATAEAAERAALTPEQRLGKDWPKKHKQLAPYITQLGKVRTGLNIPDQKQAGKILKSYGFEV